MIFVALGLFILFFKLLNITPFAELEWFVVCIPFVMAVLWFELLEPMLGLDKKREARRLQAFQNEIQAASGSKRRLGKR